MSAVPDVDHRPAAYRKVALFGGLYNNHVALEAAADLARRRGAEQIFCLGDLSGFGPNPDKIFPLIDRYDIACIRGNYEESLINRLEDCGCGYTHPRDNHFAQLSYDYTNRRLSDENRRRLQTFPKQMRLRVGDKSVHLAHGSPRRVNEFLWETTTSDGFLRKTAEALGVDVLCCTHTGIPWKREFTPDKWMVNVGVLGRPANDGKTNVWYAELEARARGVAIAHVPVTYDFARLAEEMRAERLPEEFVETIETGWWTTCLEILPGKERSRGKY